MEVFKPRVGVNSLRLGRLHLYYIFVKKYYYFLEFYIKGNIFVPALPSSRGERSFNVSWGLAVSLITIAW